MRLAVLFTVERKIRVPFAQLVTQKDLDLTVGFRHRAIIGLVLDLELRVVITLDDRASLAAKFIQHGKKRKQIVHSADKLHHNRKRFTCNCADHELGDCGSVEIGFDSERYFGKEGWRLERDVSLQSRKTKRPSEAAAGFGW